MDDTAPSGQPGRIHARLGPVSAPLGDTGVDDVVMEAGGLERRVRALRLAAENPCREMNETAEAGRGLRDCPGRP